MVKAKIDFLWYKAGDEIKSSELPENVNKWKSEGFIVVDEEVVSEAPKDDDSVIDKVRDVVEDLSDDGKLNNSNKKNSGRGRPKKNK